MRMVKQMLVLNYYTVQVMKEIAKTLGKKDWDFNKDPCSGENNWKSSVQVKGFENAVTCNCTFANATVCHIVSMYVICLLLCLFCVCLLQVLLYFYTVPY
jgi:hypothetical protein